MANWGFVGAGSIAASSLAPAVHAAQAAVLHAVASSSNSRAWALRPNKTYPWYDDLLDDPDVDIVYIALHNSAHRELTQRALRAGKHVLCEKPLGLTAAEVDVMIGTAREADRLLVEAAWNRWHPRTRDMETVIADGAIGTVSAVTARFDGLAPSAGNYRLDPALGGGALYDVGYYAISAALAAFGWRVPRVPWAQQQRWRPGSADSICQLLLEFPGQGSAEIHCSLGGAMAEEFTATGTSGTVSLSPPAFCAGTAPAHLMGSDGRLDREYLAVNPYHLMVEALDAAVDGRASSYLVPLEQSRLIAATIDAVRGTLLSGENRPKPGPSAGRSRCDITTPC